MNIAEKLAKNIVIKNYKDLPLEATEVEKASILDVLGCLIAGATAPGCKAVMELVSEMGGKEESTIMMYGGKVPAENAALVNATMSRALDFDACGAGPSQKNPQVGQRMQCIPVGRYSAGTEFAHLTGRQNHLQSIDHIRVETIGLREVPLPVYGDIASDRSGGRRSGLGMHQVRMMSFQVGG